METPVIYQSAASYIGTASSIKDKIAKIDAIITALLLSAVTAAENDHITEYQLNTGQTIIKANYKGAKALKDSIHAFETMKQYYINQLNGRMVRLIDGKSF